MLSGVGALDLRALGDSVTSETFLWPMIAGGFLIGVGIISSGYCPGTSLVGIASGKLDAVLAYGGVLVGQVIWAELETHGPFARFHQSGALGHVYLYDLLGIPPAIVAAALVAVALGAFLLGEKVERMLGAAATTEPAPRRWVFGGVAAVGVLALVTLLLPVGTAAVAARAGRPDRRRRARPRASSRSRGRCGCSTSGRSRSARRCGCRAPSARRPRP